MPSEILFIERTKTVLVHFLLKGSFYLQSIEIRLPEFVKFLSFKNQFLLAHSVPSLLSLTAHKQGDVWIGPMKVIYLQHAFKLSAAADATLYDQNRNVKAPSWPPFLFPLRFDTL